MGKLLWCERWERYDMSGSCFHIFPYVNRVSFIPLSISCHLANTDRSSSWMLKHCFLNELFSAYKCVIKSLSRHFLNELFSAYECVIITLTRHVFILNGGAFSMVSMFCFSPWFGKCYTLALEGNCHRNNEWNWMGWVVITSKQAMVLSSGSSFKICIVICWLFPEKGIQIYLLWT